MPQTRSNNLPYMLSHMLFELRLASADGLRQVTQCVRIAAVIYIEDGRWEFFPFVWTTTKHRYLLSYFLNYLLTQNILTYLSLHTYLVFVYLLLLSRRSWSVHLVRGRAGGRFHEGSGGRPTDSSTWRSMAWCAGVLSYILATCPKMALRPLVIRSDTGARGIATSTWYEPELAQMIIVVVAWFRLS